MFNIMHIIVENSIHTRRKKVYTGYDLGSKVNEKIYYVQGNLTLLNYF